MLFRWTGLFHYNLKSLNLTNSKFWNSRYKSDEYTYGIEPNVFFNNV